MATVPGDASNRLAILIQLNYLASALDKPRATRAHDHAITAALDDWNSRRILFNANVASGSLRTTGIHLHAIAVSLRDTHATDVHVDDIAVGFNNAHPKLVAGYIRYRI